MEFHTFPKVEDPGEVVGVLPFFRKVGNDLHVLVYLHKVAVNLADDVRRVDIAHLVGVET